MPAVLFPDVEALLVDYLTEALADRDETFVAGVVVGRALVSPRPARAVTVRDDGGPFLGDVRATARLGVNVWAQTPADVMDLANLVSALLTDSEGYGPIRQSSASRPVRIEDSSKQPLCYLTAELIVRGSPVPSLTG